MLTIEDIIARFNRPITTNELGCWLWGGATDKHGYARYASRLVHRITCGTPDGVDSRHQCPNKHCINPDHILSGTRTENMMDASRDGTLGKCRRVTDKDIETVKQLLAEGKTKKFAAKTIGVSTAWPIEVTDIHTALLVVEKLRKRIRHLEDTLSKIYDVLENSLEEPDANTQQTQ